MFDKIFNEMVNVTELKFDVAGLIPAIVQDADTRVVLMQGYMNRESLAETERSGKVCFLVAPGSVCGQKRGKRTLFTGEGDFG